MTPTPNPAFRPAPFRRYPARADVQRRINEDREACRHCLGGTCCTTEDPIALTPFDVLRLCAHLDLSPADFLHRFTQDRFPDDDPDGHRQPWAWSDQSSVVTWLRRRANSRHSPCLFLKYVRMPDGTPRRVCSVHAARPIACREYYHDTCKTRWTGEIAVLQAHGYEAIRDGVITEETVRRALIEVQNRLAAHPSEPASLLQLAFWTEMRRTLQADASNGEGAAGFALRDWQDPLADKLQRLLSRAHLRFEEKYGPTPWGDQLHPDTESIQPLAQAERDRLLRLSESRPETDFFSGPGDYPRFVAHRDWMPGAPPPPGFPRMAERPLARSAALEPSESIYPKHPRAEVRALSRRQVAAAILGGLNGLARLAGHLRALDRVLELAPPGQLEGWVAAGLRELRKASRLPVRHPAFAPLLAWAMARPGQAASARAAARLLRGRKPLRPPETLRLLATQAPDGGWGTRPGADTLPETQAEYIQQAFWQTLTALHDLARESARTVR